MIYRTFLFAATLLAVLPISTPAFGQGWWIWDTIPVFDNGRSMPLSSFAQQIVKDICGTTRPYLVPDDTILTELNRVIDHQSGSGVEPQAAFLQALNEGDLSIGTDTDLGAETRELRRLRDVSTLKIKNLDRDSAERIIQRIKTLLPDSGRYFNASELLLSWLTEPEIWDYIPILPVQEEEYRSDVLDVPQRNNARVRLKRVSLFQLEHSKGYQHRLRELEQKYSQGVLREALSPFDRITERLSRTRAVFQDLTFDPARHYPQRMVTILKNAGTISDEYASSCGVGFEMWNYLLNMGDDPSRRPLNEEGTGPREHPTTERWNAISRKIVQLSGAFDRRDSSDAMLVPNLAKVEKQFELLLRLIDVNLEESFMLMERAYPGVVFRPEMPKRDNLLGAESLLAGLADEQSDGQNKESFRRLALSYHYAVKKLQGEIEAAYLALYDNGRTLRVFPVISKQVFGEGDPVQGVQPWGTLRMALRGGDDFICRFLDPEFREKASGNDSEEQESEAATSSPSSSSQEEILPTVPGQLTTNLYSGENIDMSQEETSDVSIPPGIVEKMPTDANELYEIDLFQWEEGETEEQSPRTGSFFASRPRINDSIRWIRTNFDRIRTDYSTVGRDDSAALFSESTIRLRDSFRDAAETSEAHLSLLVDRTDPAAVEFLEKISYPRPFRISLESRYFRMAPFFWMWFFAAIGCVIVAISFLIGLFRRDMIDVENPLAQQEESEEADDQDTVETDGSLEKTFKRPDLTHSAEEYFLWIGFATLGLSVFVTILGGAMRAAISGWAPVTNMYETIVFMALSALILGLWYALYPIIHPTMKLAWRYSSFPVWTDLLTLGFASKKATTSEDSERRQALQEIAENYGIPQGMIAGRDLSGLQPDSDTNPLEEWETQRNQRTRFWQMVSFLPRVILMVLTFFAVVSLSYGEYADQHGLLTAAMQMLAMHDPIDWLVVVLSIFLIVWFVPHLILAGALFFLFLFRPGRIAAELGIVSYVEPTPVVRNTPIRGRSEMSGVFEGESGSLGQELRDNSGSVWLNLARNQILDRKLILMVAAIVTVIAGLCAQYNSTEFNPNIKPIVAVLRSNFWLTVHVVAIIIGYAAALIAWGLAAIALGIATFGRYRRWTDPKGRRFVQLPTQCDIFVPSIIRLVRMALLLLALGTILGARWADYSWGRFWSWDPKEVWALITILFFSVVLHGRIARYYNKIGVMIGALYGSIAVIITWYAINFLMKGSVHAYGGDTAGNARFFLWSFIVVNLVWGVLALFRYNLETYGIEMEEEIKSESRQTVAP